VALKIAVYKENDAGEARVAASPETVKKYTALGCEVLIETGAGENAAFTDDMYKDAGAKITKNAEETFKGAAVILRVNSPSEEEIKNYPKGALVCGMFNPHGNGNLIKAFASAGLTAMSMELLPRISRAQAMDVLSSQSNLAGYKAVLDATEHFGKAMPMMMTAAGTIAPARVFVMGAGVAGLQAIATARRLGAIVSATDVRPAAKEQVASLGASFIAVETEEFRQAETEGGYAKEMSADYKKKQQALVEETVKKQDIIITTALIPGKPAPKLITEAMVKSMKPGSVIVDLAVETGGNCELSQAGKIVKKHGVTIVGHKNVPGRLATDASTLYAKNLLNLLNLLIDKESGKLSIDWEDEIVKGITLTKGREIIHPAFSGKKEKPAAKAKTPAKGAKPKEETAEEPKPAEPEKKPAAKKNSGKKSGSDKTSSGSKTKAKK
jgi:NAD(P) transhydrogenase subunit alpha